MSHDTFKNNRIAKNTLYMYLRTLVVLAVSLYTSRIVLDILGASDYGIYSVVGGIIALMGFFQAAQSKSTSRFITFELGKNGVSSSLKNVFSAAITIHLIMALIAIIICETVGLWIIYHWIKIPTDRNTAALIVYQFSILVFVIHLIRIPYDSVVIAHEDMSVFAYFSIIEVVLQLFMVFMIKYIATDALVLYAGLMALSALVLFIMYFCYVRTKYPIYSIHLKWDKNICLKMLSFSGWTLLGSGTNAATQQGVNLLMNNYVGLIANAALGLAGQVNIAISKFISGFSTAFTPQVIKLYANNSLSDLNKLISQCSKFSFALCYIIALPIYSNMELILSIWLGNAVPTYTVGFCRMILICSLIDATTGVFNTAITATGKIKFYQIWISLSFLLDLWCSYIMLHEKCFPVYVFLSRILTRGILNMIIGLYFCKRYINFDIREYFYKTFSKIALTLLLTIIPVFIICSYTTKWDRLIFSSIFSFTAITIFVYYFLMSNSERNSVIVKIKKTLHH